MKFNVLKQDIKQKYLLFKQSWVGKLFGLFVLLAFGIWRVIRFVLAPLFWVINQNLRLYNFAKQESANRTLTDNEKWFVSSIPMLYTLTGLAGGFVAAFFTLTNFWDSIVAFFQELDFFDAVWSAIVFVWEWAWDGIVWMWEGILSAVDWIMEKAIEAFAVSPYFTLFSLLIIGFTLLIVYIVFTERILGFLQKILYILIGSPDRLSKRIEGIYKRVNQKLFIFLVGKDRIRTRSQRYFKRVVLYSLSLTLYSLIVGFLIATNELFVDSFSTAFGQSMFIATVLSSAGFFSGTVMFSLVARLLDLFARRKYALQ
jgi:hypothetical protein